MVERRSPKPKVGGSRPSWPANNIVVAAFIAWKSEKGQDFLIYSKESISESKKVVWPTKKETFQTTAIVVAFVIVMAIFLWFVDSILGWIVGILLGTGE